MRAYDAVRLLHANLGKPVRTEEQGPFSDVSLSGSGLYLGRIRNRMSSLYCKSVVEIDDGFIRIVYWETEPGTLTVDFFSVSTTTGMRVEANEDQDRYLFIYDLDTPYTFTVTAEEYLPLTRQEETIVHTALRAGYEWSDALNLLEAVQV